MTNDNNIHPFQATINEFKDLDKQHYLKVISFNQQISAYYYECARNSYNKMLELNSFDGLYYRLYVTDMKKARSHSKTARKTFNTLTRM